MEKRKKKKNGGLLPFSLSVKRLLFFSQAQTRELLLGLSAVLVMPTSGFWITLALSWGIPKEENISLVLV